MAASAREAQAAEKMCRGVSECMGTLANEPSLGLYYVMEHIQRSTPTLIANRQQVAQKTDALHGAFLDASYALDELTLVTSSSTSDMLQRTRALAESAARTARAESARSAVEM